MMNIKFFRAAFAAAAVLAVPTLSQAAPAAMDSCVKAFMSSLSAKYATAPKLRDARYIDDGSMLSSPRELTLTATNARDNRRVARAVCTVNSQGEVVSLHDAVLPQ